jgi:hypothetical protein
MTTPTPTDPQELRAEIRRTRAELGQTIEALAAKTDVKARAKDAVADVTDSAKARAQVMRARVTQRPAPVIAIVAGLLTAVAVTVYLARRYRS